jgi:hypothetical protein
MSNFEISSKAALFSAYNNEAQHGFTTSFCSELGKRAFFIDFTIRLTKKRKRIDQLLVLAAV